MSVHAFQNILPQLTFLARAQAAALALRLLVDTVDQGLRSSQAVDGSSPETCEGDIKLDNVSKASELIGFTDNVGVIRLSFSRGSCRVARLHFPLRRWANNICDWPIRVREEHFEHTANAFLFTASGINLH
jgi:hypothetical protein